MNSNKENNGMEDASSAAMVASEPERPITTKDFAKAEDNEEDEEDSIPEKGLLDQVYDFLVEEDWKGIQVDRDTSTLHLGAGGSNANFRVAIHVKADDNIILVFVQSPVKAPPEKRLTVAEYLTRANYGVTIGCFEFDFSDGEVRYKGSIDLAADGKLTAKMIDRLLGKCAYTMDRYFTGLMKIIFGNLDAVEAIREAEPLQAPHGEALSVIEALASAIAVRVVNDEEDHSETTADHGVTVEVLEEDAEEESHEGEEQDNPTLEQ